MKHEEIMNVIKQNDEYVYLVTESCWKSMELDLFTKAKNAKYAIEADAYMDCIRIINSYILNVGGTEIIDERRKQ